MKSTFVPILTLVFASAIALGTLTPPSDGMSLPLTDKQLHAVAFALLVLPLGWFRPDWWIALAITALAFGGMIELLQPMVSRSGEWKDFLADGIGVIVGLVPGQIRRRQTRIDEV